MEHIMKVVKSLEELWLLIKGTSETMKRKFFWMLLGALVASLLGKALTEKGVIRACEGTVTVGQDF